MHRDRRQRQRQHRQPEKQFHQPFRPYLQFDGGDGGSQQRQCGEGVKQLRRRHQEQHADDAQAACARTEDVAGIDARRLPAEVREDQTDAQPAAEERQHHQQIDGEQLGRLGRVPQQL